MFGFVCVFVSSLHRCGQCFCFDCIVFVCILFILFVLKTWPKDTTYKKIPFQSKWILDFHDLLNFNYLFTLIINLPQSLFFFRNTLISKLCFTMEPKLIYYWISIPSHLSLLFSMVCFFWFIIGYLFLQLKWRKTKGFGKFSTITGISMVLLRKTAITPHQ